MEAWSIRHLNRAMMNNLAQCQTEFERINVRAVCGREIRQKADEWSRIRKLTPGEVAIAESFGWKPQAKPRVYHDGHGGFCAMV